MRAINLLGKKFGKLKVVDRAAGKHSLWLCKCECGNSGIFRSQQLRRENKKNCGCEKSYKDLSSMIGKKFGRLTVVSRKFPNDRLRGVQWLCLCKCGKEKIISGRNLLSKDTKSCGCLFVETCKQRKGQKSSNWKGGRWKDKNGYVWLTRPDCPGSKIRMLEHKVVMANHLGRPLTKSENIHHKNGIRDDNRLENLELWVSHQPKGQRVTDLVEWAKEILSKYDTKERVSL